MTAPSLSIAVLAGGAASRLGGRDKGLELLDGKPLIAWVLDYCAKHVLARSAGRDKNTPSPPAKIVIVANRNIDEYARYAPVRSDATAGFRGPLAGIASALAGARSSRLLTLPVDCPVPPAQLAARLGAVLDTGAWAAVAHDGERRQPLFALYRVDLAASAATAAAGDEGVHAWQNAIGATEVDFADDKQQFHNLNTPEDFLVYADAKRTRD